MARQRARGAIELFEVVAYYNAPTGMRCTVGIDAERCFRGRVLPCPGCEYAIPEAYVRRQEQILLGTLDSVAALMPGDAFIAGQRVFYLVNAGELTRAADASTAECHANQWWCSLLEGYAHAAAGDVLAAEAGFDRALAAMPAAVRCRWNDLTPVLPQSARQRYEPLACEERAEQEARLWWLADPSFLLPGNDRRVAHFTRGVMEELFTAWGNQRHSENRFAYPALRDTVLREGWNDSWWAETFDTHSKAWAERPRLRKATHVDPCITRSMFMHLTLQGQGKERLADQGFHPAFYRGPRRGATYTCVWGKTTRSSYRFLPDWTAVIDPLRASPDAWDLSANSASERYTPRYAPVSTLSDYQVAYFRRGDSALVVAASDLGNNAVLTREPKTLGSIRNARPIAMTLESPGIDSTMWVGGLALASRVPPRAGEQRLVLRQFAARPDRLVLTAPTTWAPHLVSLEVFAPGLNGFARTRFGASPPIAPAQRVALSDLLLIAPPDRAGASPPRSFDAALPLALGTTRLSVVDTVGLFWEIYGLREGELVDLTLTVRPLEARSGLLARLSALIGRASSPLRTIRWSEPATGVSADTPWSGSVTLVLAELASGRGYEFELRAQVGGQVPVSTFRSVNIRAGR